MHQTQEALLSLARSRDISKLSLREIGKLINVPSAQTVKYHLDQLRSRGISLEQSSREEKFGGLSLISIPIVGSADCGPATIFAEDRIEGYLKVSPLLLQSKNYDSLFALRAVGSSMDRAKINSEPINDGDYVIVDSSNKEVQDKQYVVAVVDGLANIKRSFIDRANGQIVLMSESSQDYSPIFLREDEQPDALVAGRVIQVVPRPELAG